MDLNVVESLLRLGAPIMVCHHSMLPWQIYVDSECVGTMESVNAGGISTIHAFNRHRTIWLARAHSDTELSEVVRKELLRLIEMEQLWLP